ncbi:hypothetical protein KAM334_33540 [Aeromonas caviae]|nr:hypothetical protein KAM334_33540 [Aeromonas caviae]
MLIFLDWVLMWQGATVLIAQESVKSNISNGSKVSREAGAIHKVTQAVVTIAGISY